MAKIITINDARFILPEGMTTKEIQALAGMLATLATAEYKYDELTYDRYYYASQAGSQLSITDVELMTKEEAMAKANGSMLEQLNLDQLEILWNTSKKESIQ
jgi:hypothetical protein